MSPTGPPPRPSEQDALLRAWCGLRCAALATHDAWASDTGPAAARRFLSKGLAFVTAGRGELGTWTVDGTLRAVAAYWREDDSWYATPCVVGAIDARPGDDAAYAWIAQTLATWQDALDDAFDLTLDSAHTSLLHRLHPLGLGVDSAQLVGRPAHALARLEATGSHPAPWRALGFRVRVLTADRMREVIGLKSAVFDAHPEYCWFYRNPGFAARDAETIRASLDTGVHRILVDDGDALVGYVGAGVDTDNAHWGSVAGMDLVLAERARGRGLLRALYRLLLRELTARRIAVFKGGTSQPPVMHLARELERDVVGWMVRRHPPFGPEHWAPLEHGWPE